MERANSPCVLMLESMHPGLERALEDWPGRSQIQSFAARSLVRLIRPDRLTTGVEGPTPSPPQGHR